MSEGVLKYLCLLLKNNFFFMWHYCVHKNTNLQFHCLWQNLSQIDSKKKYILGEMAMKMRENDSLLHNMECYSGKQYTHVNLCKHGMLSINYGPIWTGLELLLH